MAWYDDVEEGLKRSLGYKAGKLLLYDVSGKIINIGEGTLTTLDTIVNNPLLIIGGFVVILVLLR